MPVRLVFFRWGDPAECGPAAACPRRLDLRKFLGQHFLDYGEAILVGTPAVSVRLVGAPKVVNGPRLAFHLRGNNAPPLVANSAGRFAPVANSWPSPKRLRFRPVAMFQAWLGQPADPPRPKTTRCSSGPNQTTTAPTTSTINANRPIARP